MIPKSYEKTHGDSFSEGAGRPNMQDRPLIEKTNAKRGKPVPIDLSDLDKNGRAPINFSRKAGMSLGSFCYDDDDDE